MAETDATQHEPARITIRAQREDDAAAIAAIRNAPRSRWGTLATPYESAEHWRKRHPAGGGTGRTELVACARGVVIGAAGLFRQPQARRAHVARIGIAIHDDWHGKGVGTMLFSALIDLADHWLGLRRLELSVYIDNLAAIALYQKFGFEIEATEIADAFRDGAFATSYVMGRLRGDLPVDKSPYPQSGRRSSKIPFTLRAAEPSDVESITAIMQQPVVRHGTLRAPFTTPAENAMLAAPTDTNAKALVAVAEGHVIGIAHLHPGKYRRAHAGEIALLAVHDEWHGIGAGRALLAALLDIADNWLNLNRLHLGALADNMSAIRLYEQAGFVTEGIKRADVFRAGAFADTRLMARSLSR
jgi:putative acetyltransferase